MPNRGKLVVTSIFAVALVMAFFAWWWNYERGRQSMEFWGRDAALLIRQAKQVELLRLEPASTDAAGELIPFGPAHFAVVDRQDISGAKGLLHARFALTEDASFVFETAPSNSPPNAWEYAVRFTRDRKTATVVFDFTNSRVGIAEQSRSARVIEKIVTGWRQFIARHLAVQGQGVPTP